MSSAKETQLNNSIPATRITARDWRPIDGVFLIAAERARQMSAEGWTTEHDDEHRNGEMAVSSIRYALHDVGLADVVTKDDAYECEAFVQAKVALVKVWPWESCAWKPKDPIRNLVRAGALIAAEIDRRLRADSAPPGHEPGTAEGTEPEVAVSESQGEGVTSPLMPLPDAAAFEGTADGSAREVELTKERDRYKAAADEGIDYWRHACDRQRVKAEAAEAEIARLSLQLHEAQTAAAHCQDELAGLMAERMASAGDHLRLASQLAGLRTAILTLRAYAEKRNLHMLEHFKPGGVVGYSDMVDGLNALLPDADITGWGRDPKFDHVRAALAASCRIDLTSGDGTHTQVGLPQAATDRATPVGRALAVSQEPPKTNDLAR